MLSTYVDSEAGHLSRGARLFAGISVLVVVLLVGASAPVANAAAEPPQIASVRVEGVTATGATLAASVNANGSATTYRFEYLTAAAYGQNLGAGREAFSGASVLPQSGGGAIGGGSAPVVVSQHLSGLAPSTAYRYRLRLTNSAEEVVFSPTRPFATQAATNAFELLDHRGWELVSPIEKGGGAVQRPGSIFGGGVFQAAAGGGAITYSSADSFGAGAQGAPAGSQYVASLGTSGWSSTNITTPLLSGSYGDSPDGVPYQVFSSTLGTGLLSNGERCRGSAGGECPVTNPPLPGSGAPSGFRNYYQRSSAGAFASMLTSRDLEYTSLTAAQLELRLVSATPELDHVVLSSCAALAPGATEVAAPGGCASADQNLYEWSGGNLALINFPPGETTGVPGATIGASAGAISTNGVRVYFRVGDDLFLREGAATRLVDASATGAEFQVASSDGAIAYLLDGGNLERYEAASGNLTPLTTSGEVEGVLGASPDGTRVFFAEAGKLFVDEGGTSRLIAAGAAESDWPPATGTARVSPDGRYLVFLSAVEVTEYPNEGKTEVYRYGPVGGAATLTCASCNPSGERPVTNASIPGARPNGAGAEAFDAYKPRVLSADGSRVFFDSGDSLVPQDTNGQTDVYEWEAAGAGTCATPGGCVQLISSGRSNEASTFVDASADGSESFFQTTESIYPVDPGSGDIYDARIGGGFTVPSPPIPCNGDACQVLPEAPEDPTPGTLVPNSGNPPLQIAGSKPAKHKKKKPKKKHSKRKSSKKKTKGKGGKR